MTVKIDPKHVEQLAAQGLTPEEIANSLDCSRTTLYRQMKSEEDVKLAIQRGRSKGMATITNALFQTAKHGNVTAQIFYLKNRDPQQWRDRRALEVSGQDGEPLDMNWTVTIVDPQNGTNGTP